MQTAENIDSAIAKSCALGCEFVEVSCSEDEIIRAISMASDYTPLHAVEGVAAWGCDANGNCWRIRLVLQQSSNP